MSEPGQFAWIAVCGTIVGFVYAFGIGANDVANAFASSVSSKSLTLKQAVIAASIFEFLGAILLGSAVTNTIRSKIINIDLYLDNPYLLMFGMFTSILTAAIMLLVATHFALPVSTTHTIVGCIMGFSIAAKGFSSVDWEVAKTIFISWAASPLISGVLAFLLYGALRMFVLSAENAYIRTYWTFPLILTVGVGIDLFYIIYKGANHGLKSKLALSWVLPVSFGTGALLGVIWLVLIGPWAKRRMLAAKAAREAATEKKVDVEAAASTKEMEVDSVEEGTEQVKSSSLVKEEPTEAAKQDDPDKSNNKEPLTHKPSFIRRASQSFIANTVGQDLEEQSRRESKRASHIWDKSTQYDPDAEYMFTYIQVFTACLNSFAHGANDVSNAIAPISAMISIYKTGILDPSSPVYKWILALGGIGIVLGLLLYGYKVMKSVGFKLVMLSPSRGATAELSASLTVVSATFLQIPVSSTQCIVGAVSGIGLTFGPRNVEWLFLLRVCIGWVLVFFVSAVLSAGVFSFAAYSPDL